MSTRRPDIVKKEKDCFLTDSAVQWDGNSRSKEIEEIDWNQDLTLDWESFEGKSRNYIYHHHQIFRCGIKIIIATRTTTKTIIIL